MRGQEAAAPNWRHASPLDRLTEAALAYADAEEDGEWDRARERLRKAAHACAIAAALEVAREKMADASRTRLAEMKAAGMKLGRPRKVEAAVAVSLVIQQGSIAKAARALSVSRRTVERAVGTLRAV